MKIQYRTGQITVFESQLFRTTTTVIDTDDMVLLVDPNWLPSEIEFLQQHIAQVHGARPLYLLFTHSDYDHIIGYKAFPNAKCIASKAFVQNKQKADILKQIETFDHSYYLTRNYPILYPEIDYVVEKDGQQLKLGTTTLTFYLAPGHNADGIFTIIEPINCWIAGDYFSNVEFPFIYHSSLAYEMTLDKMEFILKNHAVALLVAGHGDCTTEQAEMLQRRNESLKYIQSLRKAIQTQTPFDSTPLWAKYQFPLLQETYHKANIKLMQKELGV